MHPGLKTDRMEQLEGTWKRRAEGIEIDLTHRVEFPFPEYLPGDSTRQSTADESDISIDKIELMRILLEGDFAHGFVGGEVPRPNEEQWIGDKTQWRVEATSEDRFPQSHVKR